MVMFSHEVGKSHTVLKTFGSIVGMPAMHLTTYQDHDTKVTAAEVEAGEELMQRSADAIRQAYADTDPDPWEALDGGQPYPCIDISVSFDRTWQKRGFTSLYGVGICIDVLTGLVIDYHVLSKYCHACAVNTKRLPPAELAVWKANHAPDCCINHHQSSKAMEQEAAKVLWGRSVSKYGLRYVEMLSDGDFSAFKAVCGINPYGDEIAITKLDCVNHAHKRMGTALRKLTKEQGLGGRGVGRLTEQKCKNLQNFYRGAILDNIPNTDNMRCAVWATLYHSMSTDQEPHHRQCPKGENSRCFYQKALALGEVPSRHTDHPSRTFLCTAVAHKMIPVYRRMSDEALLRRMTHGGTQNTNECLNATIWARCPKTYFMGMRRLQGSVARAVSAFNEGATEMLGIMNKLYVDISYITLELLTKKDQLRIRQADAVNSRVVREHRKEYAAQRRRTAREEERRDGDIYAAGEH
ncbi:hypothetical protein ACOMHN_032402 [Nucella lapillus]